MTASSRAGEPLVYRSGEYRRYDASPAQDAAKKHLEAINLHAEVDLTTVRRALDVGTATCRYPAMLDGYGIEAHGVDVRLEGFTRHRAGGGGFRRFVQGDGCRLPYATGTFDLVTSMMGTVNHVPPRRRRGFVGECRRVLAPGGSAVFSLWDPGCPYVSHLAMYSAGQAAVLRDGGVDQSTFAVLAAGAGFTRVRCVPFCFLPDRLVRALWLDPPGGPGAGALADIDRAVRVGTGASHGQMYLAVCAG